MMQAAVYHKFGGPIEIEKIPIPDIPRDGVLVMVKATGVCRSDWHGWRGHDDDIKSYLSKQPDKDQYFVPGHEVSGVVVSLGDDVVKFKLGDRVVVPFILSCGSCRECGVGRNRRTICEDQIQPGFTQLGSFAEYLAVPRADLNVCRLPENVGFNEAAALGCRFTTAFRAILQQGKLQTGQTIAVFGVGGLGLSCIMIANTIPELKAIIAIDVSRLALHKAVKLVEMKCSDGKNRTQIYAINAREGDNYVREEISRITDGVGVDLSIDAAGFKSTCENAIYCTRRGGKMVQVGLPIDNSQQPIVPMGRVAGREIEIIGSHGMSSSDFPKVIDLVSSQKLDPKILIENEVDLKTGAKILESMDTTSPLGITMITNFHSEEKTLQNTSKL